MVGFFVSFFFIDQSVLGFFLLHLLHLVDFVCLFVCVFLLLQKTVLSTRSSSTSPDSSGKNQHSSGKGSIP